MSFHHIAITVFVSLFFISCSLKNVPEGDKSLGKKSFDNEDELIVKALYYKENGDLNGSLKLFYDLLEFSKKDVYRLEIAEILISQKELKSAEELLLEIKKEQTLQNRLNRLLLDVYLLTNNRSKGEKLSEEIIKSDPSAENYELISSVYLGFGDTAKALKALESAYGITKEPQVAGKIADIMYIFIGDKHGAITFLNSHVKMFGCDRAICNKLIFYQRKERNINGVSDAYRMLYKETKDVEVAKEYIEVLIVKKDYESAQKILEESRVNDTLLLEVYKALKKHKLALSLAKKLYGQTNEYMFLAEIAILEYELSPNRNDRDFLKKIDKMMSEALSHLDSDTYQNFLGYILIDHNYNIERGIELVQKALNKNPNSPYYLDSLAWGYYKKKECKKAYEIMKKVVDTEGTDEPEIRLHWEKIRECK